MSIIGIIGGSGAYSLLTKKIVEGKRLEPLNTPFGISQPIYQCSHGDNNFYFLSRHGEKDYSITATEVNYRANIYALKSLGIQKIIAWSGPGAINTDFAIGDYAIPHDIIDETKYREDSFYRGKGIGFIRQNPTFCPSLREILKNVLDINEFPYHNKSVYVCTEGPRLETSSEINKFKIYGGDLVGMTLVPEVFLAKELEICYSAICYITNYAEGVREREFKEGILFEGLLDKEDEQKVEKSINNFPTIVLSVLEAVKDFPFECKCSKFLDRYRKKGLL